jgi:hypothetical protein
VLKIGDLAVQRSISVGAREIDMGIRQAGTQGLELIITGAKGGVAKTVDLRIDAPTGVSLPTFRADQAKVTSTSHSNRIDRGFVTGTLDFISPDGNLKMVNTSTATVAGVAIQLFAPAYSFMLSQQGMYYTTDAYVTQYASTVRPTVPNYQGSHLDSDVMFATASAVRDAERYANDLATKAAAESLPRLAHAPVQLAAALHHSDDAKVINLDTDDGIASPQNISIEAE